MSQLQPSDDERLKRIETDLKTVTGAIGKIRERLGDRNTTLIFDLDERYLTRKDAISDFVPRKEHEAREEAQRAWRRQLPLIVFAGGGWLTSVGVFVYTLVHG